MVFPQHKSLEKGKKLKSLKTELQRDQMVVIRNRKGYAKSKKEK